MLILQNIMSAIMGSNTLASSGIIDIDSAGPSVEGSLKCAGGENGRYLCAVATTGKGSQVDLSAMKNVDMARTSIEGTIKCAGDNGWYLCEVDTSESGQKVVKSDEK
ncbi:hypothetical protein JCM33374_g3771 [Metschnikowia sp. JCM 33374]|nr:hypothetical protein JCM33374_g3771 [Metschnikowia sp. JCM 33374]